MFRKTISSRVFQNVVEQVQEAIVSRKLSPGDQLPAERELKEMFGVSRGTLREAFRVLEQKGLIEIRTGVAGGAVVRDLGTEQVSETLGLLVRTQQVSLQSLAEFREGLDGLVAGLAARRVRPEDLEGFEDLLAHAEQMLDRGPDHYDAFVRLDEELHMGLARVTGNPLFISVLETVYRNIHTYYESYLAMEEPLLRENLRDLQRIVAAVAAGEAERATDLARDHVRRFTDYMEQKRAAERDTKRP